MPRLTVALTFDHDAISDGVRRGDSPVKLSHAEFGHRVGVPRILDLLERESIPSDVVRAGPHARDLADEQAEAILAGGPRAGRPWLVPRGLLGAGAETRRGQVLDRSVDAVRRLTGAPPKGFRAPYWALGDETLELVEEAGFDYDSSLMADDYRPYRVRLEATGIRSTEGTSLRDARAPSRGAGLLGDGRLAAFRARATAATASLRRPRCSRSGRASCAAPGSNEPGGTLDGARCTRSASAAATECDAGAVHRRGRELDGVVFDRLDRYLDRWEAGKGSRMRPRSPDWAFLPQRRLQGRSSACANPAGAQIRTTLCRERAARPSDTR